MSYPAKILLIRLVKQHVCIWNTRSPDYARPDLKIQAWEEISDRMQANGFEFDIGRLKTMWKNLRDQWKRNLSAKMPPEREWYFQRRINFLVNSYEGGERSQLAQDNDSADDDGFHLDDEAPDDSLYDVKDDGFDYLETGHSIESVTSTGGSSPFSIREPKSEIGEEVEARPQTLVTVLRQNGTLSSPRRIVSQSPNASVRSPAPARSQTNPRVVSVTKPSLPKLIPPTRTLPGSKPQSSASPAASAAKKARVEQTSKEDSPADAPPPKTRDDMMILAKALKAGKSVRNDLSPSQSPRPVDKFDKYAAFISTTLREMPEMEAKRKMREMTMLLLDDVDFGG
ncbi:hypothetical protein Q1695_004306 [Nippostrongylus brasiliensis]|nr:hypothetical protein Q1695_004306 [Nippostrongylus brasiliensis]